MTHSRSLPIISNNITKMVYFHVLVCHVGRWKATGGLGRWSSHRLENGNRLMKDAKWHHSTRDRLEEKADEPMKPEETTSSISGSSSSGSTKQKQPTKKQQKQGELQIRPQQCMTQLIQIVRYVNQRASEVLVGARRPPQEHHCTKCMAVGHNRRSCTCAATTNPSSFSKLPHASNRAPPVLPPQSVIPKTEP